MATFDDLESGIVNALDAADKQFAKFTVYEQGTTISENLDYIALNHTNGDWYRQMGSPAPRQKGQR